MSKLKIYKLKDGGSTILISNDIIAHSNGDRNLCGVCVSHNVGRYYGYHSRWNRKAFVELDPNEFLEIEVGNNAMIELYDNKLLVKSGSTTRKTACIDLKNGNITKDIVIDDYKKENPLTIKLIKKKFDNDLSIYKSMTSSYIILSDERYGDNLDGCIDGCIIGDNNPVITLNGYGNWTNYKNLPDEYYELKMDESVEVKLNPTDFINNGNIFIKGGYHWNSIIRKDGIIQKFRSDVDWMGMIESEKIKLKVK